MYPANSPFFLYVQPKSKQIFALSGDLCTKAFMIKRRGIYSSWVRMPKKLAEYWWDSIPGVLQEY